MKEKKQLKVFLLIAFILPYLLGILMGYAHYKGMDVSCFPNAQMYYPAAGVMVAILLLHKEDLLVPKRFYICFIILTFIMVLLTVGSVLVPDMPGLMVMNYIIVLGSAVSWIFLLSESKEKRAAYGLRGTHIKTSIVLVTLFVVLYLGRIFLSSLLDGRLRETLSIFKDPMFYAVTLSLPLNFFLVFTAFFGEEYGWRYYFTPYLQKYFGKIKGVLLLGVLWGIWHLPINVFYYSPDSWLQSILAQQSTCIAIGIFFTYAYMKTNNIWVPVIMHFLNNNLIAALNYGSTSAISNQLIGWNDLIVLIVVNTILFVPFILMKEYRHGKVEETEGNPL